MAHKFLSRLEILLEKLTGKRTYGSEEEVRPEIDTSSLQKGARKYDKIVSVYNWFFTLQLKWYDSLLEKYPSVFAGCHSACDIGCGTGAFGMSLAGKGLKVTGVDLSRDMTRACCRNGLNCVIADAVTALPFRDRSFDAVSAAFFIHGFSAVHRKYIYEQCRRVARKVIVFHDYNTRRNPLIDFIEYLEGSDYHNFILSAPEEMSSYFSSVEVLPAGRYNNWYVCQP